MGPRSKSKARPKTLTHGRPPLSKSQHVSLSSRATRSIIRSHHVLQKQVATATAKGDHETIRRLQAELDGSGGLESYQLASTLGQAAERGGDTSKVLVEWLRDDFQQTRSQNGRRLRMLEIGALSTKNACSNVDCLDVKRIDLKSTQPGIEEVDFMHMPIPHERFDVVSLSLVLNFVPTASARGDMLRRVSLFLRHQADIHHTARANTGGVRVMPCLFLVLPLPCVANSRYLDMDRLRTIMKSLGYDSVKSKRTTKLYYELYVHSVRNALSKPPNFKKEELRKGNSRNNFAIVLGDST